MKVGKCGVRKEHIRTDLMVTGVVLGILDIVYKFMDGSTYHEFCNKGIMISLAIFEISFVPEILFRCYDCLPERRDIFVITGMTSFVSLCTFVQIKLACFIMEYFEI